MNGAGIGVGSVFARGKYKKGCPNLERWQQEAGRVGERTVVALNSSTLGGIDRI